MTDELVMYCVVRTDLGMSPGKVAAQVGHGVQLAMRLAETCADESVREALENWESAEYPKVILGANDRDFFKVWESDKPSECVYDNGRTELQGKNATVIAFCPATRSSMKKTLGRLRLYR